MLNFYNVFFGAPRVVPDRQLLIRLDIFLVGTVFVSVQSVSR